MLSHLFAKRDWALYNPLKSWVLQGLTLREAQVLVSSFSAQELGLVLVWKKGWDVWQNLNWPEAKVLRESQMYDIGAPDVEKNISEALEITHVHSSSLSSQTLTGIMKYSWRPINIPVEVIQMGKTFLTRTTEVSEVAMLFEDPLPSWVSGYFTVAMKIGNKPVEVICGLVEDQRGAKVFVEVVETADEEGGIHDYRAWIKSLTPRQSE